ncbi:MAG: hypothetical protein O7D34_12630, partial [Ignavibacteria bacterium]|nr:hypothetical protein [Ignavibacteria bacterium]
MIAIWKFDSAKRHLFVGQTSVLAIPWSYGRLGNRAGLQLFDINISVLLTLIRNYRAMFSLDKYKILLRKTTLIISMLLLPYALCAQWLPQNSGTPYTLWSAYFANNKVGWIVYSDTVSKTIHGGITWSSTHVGVSSILTGLYFVGS